jgi:PleD family two-component response regulator
MARILIIDDDRDIHPLRLALENAGYEVLEAQDGAEGLRLWVDRGADLVITDVHMPEKDGLERVAGKACRLAAFILAAGVILSLAGDGLIVSGTHLGGPARGAQAR